MTTTRKVKIPDGKGGWVELEGEVLPGASVDVQKQAEALRKQFIVDAAALTVQLVKWDKQYLTDMGLGKEHRAFAAALYCLNLRETYPGVDGKPDPEAFDVFAQMAADYYDANAPKR